MIQAQKTIYIEGAPQDVWSVLTDFTGYPKWVTDIVEVRVSPGTPGVGTQVTEVRDYGGRRVEGVEEIVAWTPQRELRLKTPSGSFVADAVYRLAPDGQGTRVDYNVAIVGRGFGRILELIVRGGFQKSVDKEFDRLKALVERHDLRLPAEAYPA